MDDGRCHAGLYAVEEGSMRIYDKARKEMLVLVADVGAGGR